MTLYDSHSDWPPDVPLSDAQDHPMALARPYWKGYLKLSLVSSLSPCTPRCRRRNASPSGKSTNKRPAIG